MDTPKLRFNGFENPWRNILFNEIFDYLRNNTFSRDCLNYQNGSFKNIHYGDILTKFGANVNVCQTNVPFINTNISFKVDKQKLLQDGDIVFADTAEDEAVGRCIEISGAEKTKTVSGLHTIPVRPKIVFAPYFLGYDLNSKGFHNRLKPLMQGIKVMSLNRTALEKIKVEYPEEIKEQRMISLFFCNIDQEINTKITEIESLRQVKTAAMISMFPQKGEDAPRVRFKGFDEPWKTIKARKLFKTFNERNRPEMPVLSAFQDNRGMAVREDSGYNISHDIRNEATYKHVLPGQFVMHLRSFQGGFAHSSVEGITSPAYTVFGFIDEDSNYDYFWKLIFMSKAFIKRLETTTYGIRDGRSISFDEFLNLSFLVPSKAEQQKITEFFQNLDRQIKCQSQILERLKRVKAACLDQMFV